MLLEAGRGGQTGVHWLKQLGDASAEILTKPLTTEPSCRACNEFVDAIGPKRAFMGGDKPNLADLAVYGVLKAVEKTPTYEDALANSKIRPWVERTAAAIGGSARVSTEGSTWGLAPPGTPVARVP